MYLIALQYSIEILKKPTMMGLGLRINDCIR